MRYGDCRWIDVEDLDKQRVVVVCPLASLEQHGHHLPLLTDTYLVTEVAERVERELVNSVLLTPTLWLGASDHHLDFPGTITVPNSLYVEILKNMVRCFVKAGFQRLLFLNGHGGNIAPAQVGITEMVNSSDLYEEMMIVFSSYWTLASDAFAPEKHGLESPQVTHACEYETSMMLSCHYELVRMDHAKAGPPILDNRFFHSERGGRVSLANRFRKLTATGAMGKPELATAAKGDSLLAAAATEVAAFINEFLSWPRPEVLKP